LPEPEPVPEPEPLPEPELDLEPEPELPLLSESELEIEPEPEIEPAPTDEPVAYFPFSFALPAEDSHWTQVRSFVLEVEEANPEDLRQIIEAVVERFPTYTSVQTEARRILGE